jgi:hypothetical protein
MSQKSNLVLIAKENRRKESRQLVKARRAHFDAPRETWGQALSSKHGDSHCLGKLVGDRQCLPCLPNMGTGIKHGDRHCLGWDRHQTWGQALSWLGTGNVFRVVLANWLGTGNVFRVVLANWLGTGIVFQNWKPARTKHAPDDGDPEDNAIMGDSGELKKPGINRKRDGRMLILLNRLAPPETGSPSSRVAPNQRPSIQRPSIQRP